VWDAEGRRFIDWVQGKGAVTLGHAVPDVDEAVAERARQGVLLGACPTEYEALASELARWLPGVEQVVFVKNGSDAVHVAMRLARVHTGRDLILSAGYHGWDDRLLPSAAPSPVPGAVLDFGFDLALLERLLAERGERVAAVLVTPEPAFFGPELLAGAAELARGAGALFIVDEVRAGLRVAPAGAHQRDGVHADLFTLSKGLANGFPLAAVLGRRDVLESSARTYVFGTYYAEAVSLAAALAVLQHYRERDVLGAIERAGRELLLGLEAVFAEEGLRARCLGPAPVLQVLFEDEAAEEAFYRGAVRRGVLFFQNDAQCPSAAHGAEVIAQTLETCRGVARDVRREHQGGRAERLVEPSPELLVRAAGRRMIRPEAVDSDAVRERLGQPETSLK
jgi:glutamate-1-semialdehyde aminotransferase